MEIVHIEPGDGCHYRVVIGVLEGLQAEQNNVSSPGFFFAFGIGNRPVKGYFFTRGVKPSYSYIDEKLGDIDRNNPWTTYIMYSLVCAVSGVTATTLGIPESVLEKATKYLDANWTDSVREVACVEFELPEPHSGWEFSTDPADCPASKTMHNVT